MILYGSSGIGALEEVLLLSCLAEKEKDAGAYFVYPQSPDLGVKAVHRRFCLGSDQASFKRSKEIITRDFGLQSLELTNLFSGYELWRMKLAEILEQVPGNDFNVINHLNFRTGVRKANLLKPTSYLKGILDWTMGDLHKSGFYLGGRIIYWSLAAISKEEGWNFMAPAMRTDEVYSFFDANLLKRVGYWHIRLAGKAEDEEGWEPVPPTIWPLLDQSLRADLKVRASWLIDHYPVKTEVLLEGDKEKVKAFYRGLPLF